MIDWQTPAAIGVVLLALIFLIKTAVSKKGCGSGCDCAKGSSPKK